MTTRASLAQAREDLDRARREAEDRFHEWAVLLAKEAAEDALTVVIDEAGGDRPATEKLAPLVSAALGDVAADDPIVEHAARVDELHDPAVVEDLREASLAEREGGKADYVDADDAWEAIERAEAIVDACERTLSA